MISAEIRLSHKSAFRGKTVRLIFVSQRGAGKRQRVSGGRFIDLLHVLRYPIFTFSHFLKKPLETRWCQNN